MEPKFSKGDVVAIRPFNEIDSDDIGRVGISENSCFSIPCEHINRQSASGEKPYVVTRIDCEYSTYIYRLRLLDSDEERDPITYWWAQGMLRPYVEQTELPDADDTEFFGFLYGEAEATA